MQDELHAAALVKKTLGDDARPGRHRAQHGTSAHDVLQQLARRGLAEAALVHQPRRGSGNMRIVKRDMFVVHARHAAANLLTQGTHKVAQHVGALRCFTGPERHVGRCTVGILHQHAAFLLHHQDAPARIAQLDHIAGPAIDGVMLIERGDLCAFGLQDDGEDRRVRNRSAVADRRHPRASAGVQLARYAIAQEVRAVAAARVFDALMQYADELIELRAGEIPVGIRTRHQAIEIVLAPWLRAAHGDHLLHQDVERLWRNLKPVK